MRSSTAWLAAATTFFTSAFAYSDAALVKRADFTPVTGVQGDVKPRLELRQLQREEPEQFTLFMLAMDKFQQTDVGNAGGSGYDGVASIHGVPAHPWGGVNQCENCTSSPPGYCTHASCLFPSWHRVYMALFEQQLSQHAKEIADLYSGASKDTMQQAAVNLRLPYFDWAATPPSGQTCMPDFLTNPSIDLAGPSGNQTIANPMFSRTIQDPQEMGYVPYNTWGTTLRHPTSGGSDASSNEQDTISTLQAKQPELQSEVYSIFTQCKGDYLGMSNTASANKDCSTSLEGVHNDVHSFLGGIPDPSGNGAPQGHMTYLPLAAYDPVFYVHHANVDRIFALWQAVNPDAYGASQVAPMGTYTIAAGTVQDANSPLTPFKKESGEFWTTNDVKDWSSTFKYTYPEFLSSDGSSNAIQNYVNALYGPKPVLTAGSVPTSTNSSLSSSPSAGNATGTLGYNSTNSNGGFNSDFPHLPNFPKVSGLPSVPGLPNFMQAGAEFQQYVANIQTPRSFFNNSYSVYLFDGAAGEATAAWTTAENLIGMMNVLSGGMNMAMTVMSYGSIDMTKYLQKLVDAGKLASMKSEDVLPYLSKHLDWKIVAPKEGVVSPADVKGFDVSVLSSLGQFPGQGLLPVLQPAETHLNVTKGKIGGAAEIPKFIEGVVGAIFGGDSKNGISSAVGDMVGTLLGGNHKSSEKSTDAYTSSSSSSSAGDALGSMVGGLMGGFEKKSSEANPAEYGSKSEDVVTMIKTVTTTYCPCKTAAPAAYTA